MMTNTDTVKLQPVDDLQLQQLVVEWVPRESVRPNAYNPNRMTPADRALLIASLLEDGWTGPVVTLLDGTIVDGEQRWTVAGLPMTVADIQAVIDRFQGRTEQGYTSESIMTRLLTSRDRLAQAIADGLPACLASVTGGMVPITRVDFGDKAHVMMSTIRHNRARGTHMLDRMAEITDDLLQLGLDLGDLQKRLGMAPEETARLLQTLPTPQGILDSMGGTAQFSQAWQPEHVARLGDDALAATGYQRSMDAQEAARTHAQAEASYTTQVDELTRQRVAEAQAASQTSLTYLEKERIRQQVKLEVAPVAPPPPPPELKKLIFFITVDEFMLVHAVLGEEPVQGFMRLVREDAERRGIQATGSTVAVSA